MWQTERKTCFGDLYLWDLFETGPTSYFMKVKSTNGYNAILLTGPYIEWFYFEDDEKVVKFR